MNELARAVTTANVSSDPYWWDAARPEKSDSVALPAQADVVIIGAGYTGLSAALLLVRRGRTVVVVDREDPGLGSSRRNAGFLGRVLKKSFTALKDQRGLDHALRVYGELNEAYYSTLTFIEAEKISCFAARPGRFIGATSATHYELLARELEAMKRHLDLPFEMVAKKDVHTELASDAYFGGAVIPDLGSLHPGLYHKGLQDRVAQAGALIRGNTDVFAITPNEAQHRWIVKTTSGDIEARDVFVATNGYTTGELNWWSRRVIPFKGYMAATEELNPDLVRKIIPNRRVVIDTNTNIDFFRPAPDSNRILLGGATAGGMNSTAEIAIRLHKLMSKDLPDLSGVRFSHVWSGYCAGTFDMMPHAGGKDGLWHAMGYNFAGVTMGSYLGRKIALQIVGDRAGDSVFSQDPFPTMPFYRGKPWFLPLAMRYFEWRDRKTARTAPDKTRGHS